jgi:hypothetical protein
MRRMKTKEFHKAETCSTVREGPRTALPFQISGNCTEQGSTKVSPACHYDSFVCRMCT